MRRRGDVMWRNFGWTAILATWTIFLILNSGLAGEQILKKPQNNNEDNVHHETTHPVFDKKVVDYSRLRYARENFKSNDRSSMHAKAVSLEFKNTENRDSRLNGHEKHIAMSNAIATTKYLKDSDDKSERLITKRTGNVWLSKVIVMEKSKNTRNYLKFMSSLRPPPPTSQELKSASRKKRRKERTIYVFLNDHKKMGTIRHDIQAHDKKGGRWKKYERDRIFSGENGMTAFFPDKFTKNSRSEKDSSTQKLKNSDISQLKTTKAEIIVSRYANGAHKHNRNERDFRQSLELTKNSTNKLIYVRVNDKSRRVEPTFSNYSSSEVNRSCGNETITTTTDNAIIENSPYQRSVAVTWTTLIFNSKISSVNGEVGDEENTVSPSSEYSKSKSYKVNEFLASAETYKRNEYSKVGFKVSTDTHGNKKENGNSVDSFTSRASNSLNNHFAKKRASFTKRPFLHRKKNELKASDIFDQRRQYYFPTSDINTNRKTRKLGEMRIRKKTEEKEITAAANYATHDTLGIEPDPSPTNLSTKGIDKSNLDYQMPVRISVTQKRNPIHVRHVGSDADCERRRRTEFEAGVRDAFRIGLRNVSNPSTTAKFNSFLDQKPNGRPKYSQKFHAINVGTLPRIAETTDGKLEHDRDEPRGTSTESVSIFFGGANIGDNSIGMRKINGHVQSSSELTDEPGLENVRVTTRRGGNHRDMNEGSGFYSRSDGVHNSKYRRYKRHEDRNTPRISTSTEFDSGTWKTLDTATTTSNLLIEFTANPPISTTETNNVDQISTSAKEVLTSVEAPPSSKYREFQKEWQSTPLTTNHDERYTNAPARMGFNASDSSEISLIDAPKTFNVSSVETPYLIEAHDRSRATTKIDNSIIPKEVPPAVEANVRISDATNKNAFEVSSTELINSQGEQGAYGNESVWTIDPLPQKNNDPSRGIFESITMENIIDSSASDVLSDQWPVKHSAVVEGDLVLGGLMMVHEREDRITCGRVMPQGGIQALEAMLYTLDTLNDREIVPGVKIGAHILDDCDKDTYGLEMAVDFIKGSISNIDGAEYHCNKTAVRKVISGVVGAASSVTSIQVANLLRLFKIPQVSYFSTSPELSNKQRFEYFTRTIPSDHYQVKAMVDIVLTMGWSYVSIIYEESNYGIKAFEELEELLGRYNICIAVKEKLVKDSGVAKEVAYDNIVLKLLTKPRARGCIIFGSDQEVAGVMRAVRRCKATGVFSWIGSDGWSARGLVSNGNEPEVEGTLSVQPQANPVKGFEEYFLNLTVENNRRNPWFVEFWEDHFKCRYPNSPRTRYNTNYTETCTTKERLTKQNTAFEDQLQFVSDAVMAFAYAFRDMHRDLCQRKAGLCDEMKPTKGTTLLQYLRKVDFEGLSGDKFRFDKDGDGPARYNIIHFKQTEPGKYKWIRVGKYLEGELRLNMSEIQFKLGHPQPPVSVCSLPCEVGQAKKYVEGERCCWHCFNCTQYQIRDSNDETQCSQCERGTLPDETHSMCQDVPEEFLRPESGWAIGAMSFSATGILVTLFVCGVFLKHNDTPVVRASGRELSYVLLLGILLCYLVTFTLIFKPTHIVCGIQRFAAGFCFTVVYAALLTKTNRISRIFNAGSAKRPSFISPRSQLIICSGLVSVQILINIVWMIIDPARAMHHYPTMEDNLLVCNNYIDTSYMIAFTYPIILIIVCTIYAVLTRKIPEAFNESKHIGLTMYTTCVIWLAFVPLYYGTGSNVALRITSMSVTISLSASVTVVCLFSPKLYIILIRPERNVRPTVRAGRPNPTKSSAITVTNASSMMGPVTATTVLTAATCDQNKAIKKHIASTMDCSTQSEYYEMELKERKNGESLTTCISRSTQTTANEKEFVTVVTSNKKSPDVIVSASNMESINSTTTKRLNSNARIGNGPLSQSDVSL
ncbi:metabotropic glutamate receptor B isoform X1 [Temnothorax longispinosus]|uniref:metabotropic glutamate receptor B isoform X1 n=1 Tax=Temnothorax longispinosus TaxID=300112 RepID=UPI003A9A254D